MQAKATESPAEGRCLSAEPVGKEKEEMPVNPLKGWGLRRG